ncbi:hypothetical protein TcasGA2_TC033153 [Tribolium castaneum]|uniref:Uncharacterized protein n=1 Tax=Tribolium castaneum TaxID=7070 RepID=A0A139WHF7_TRICA|nr:PREDICTED: uncharacterized protein LOC107397965 [Tribolium castaneum]KYB27227.1 hypothetical protein TcasGA2_TC033153 [Tribolium castaneum]|eukprot:XP_015835676.1 PREDICTED: uncharacterized protein LOC107397965 [Tribolium castaneum]
MCMLNKYIQELDNYSNRGSIALLHNESYQKEITARLKFCIKRHQEIIHVTAESVKIAGPFIVPFLITGLFLGTGQVLSILEVLDGVPIQLWRIACLSIATLICASCFLLSGQSIESESERIFSTLIQLDWYNWNNKNRRLLLTVLANSLKPIQFKFATTFVINYVAGLNLCKMIYSAVSVFTSVF